MSLVHSVVIVHDLGEQTLLFSVVNNVLEKLLNDNVVKHLKDALNLFEQLSLIK